MESEGSTNRSASSLRGLNPGQKRKAEEEARGREQAKMTQQPQLQLSEPTTVVFIQALVARYRGTHTLQDPEFIICKRPTAPGIGMSLLI